MIAGEKGGAVLSWLAGLSDASILRAAFAALLSASAVFLAIDYQELSAATAAREAEEPAAPLPDGAEPFLPPALTTGEPADPPAPVRVPAEALRQPIRFTLQPGGVLLAEGAIDPGAAARFAEEIGARGEYVKTVSLNSPGGSVGDALAMSRLIRDKKLGTLVADGALCASSCPILFSGGVTRHAGQKAVIGVHQVYRATREPLSPDRAMAEAQKTTAAVTRHLDEMGVKPGLWQLAMETPPDRLHYLSTATMAELSLTTPEAGSGG